MVGGGITGLVAARDLVAAGHDVVLLEATDRVGGTLASRRLATGRLDVGADSLLARHRAGVALAGELGLELVHPTTGAVQVVADGRLRPLPRGAPYGVPTDLVSLARSRVLSPVGLARAAAEAVWPRRQRTPADRSVGEVVAARYGTEVVDRLVEPMVGGIYAGRPDRLSVEATTPLVAAADRDHRSLAHGLQHALAGRADRDAPVFATPVDLMASLPAVLADGLGTVVRTGHAVASIDSATGDRSRWRLQVVSDAPGVATDEHGATAEGGTVATVEAAAVVVATPAHVASRLLGTAAPGSAAELATIDHASVAVVALHYGDARATDLPAASGILVPRREGRLVKAATWLARKWPHLADRGAVLRASVGRIDDHRHHDLDDAELARVVDREVRDLAGLSTAATDQVVVRWDRALPQYDVGHRERVDRVRHHLPAGIVVAGAAYDGIGVSPCVASGRAAAGDVADLLATWPD